MKPIFDLIKEYWFHLMLAGTDILSPYHAKNVIKQATRKGIWK